MQPARRFGIAHRFLHHDGERDHVVPDFGFDLVDPRHVNARPLAQFARRLLRDDSGFGERFRRGQLDVQPLLEFIFFAPDAAHLRTRIACDQFRLPDFELLAGNIPAP